MATIAVATMSRARRLRMPKYLRSSIAFLRGVPATLRPRPSLTEAAGKMEAPMAGVLPRMSVVVATSGRAELLRQTLPALAASVAAVSGAELLIVEQRGRATVGLCADLGVAAEVVSDPGQGASRARNLGTAEAEGEVVLFTDDDCVVPERWVADHQRAHAAGTIV